MSTPQERATGLLVHYFELLARRSGVRWDEDNDAEIRSIVDSIEDMVDAKVREAVDAALHQHTDNAPHLFLYPDGSS